MSSSSRIRTVRAPLAFHPGDQMRAGHAAEFLRAADAGEAHEVLSPRFRRRDGCAGCGCWRTIRPRAERRRVFETRRRSRAGRQVRFRFSWSGVSAFMCVSPACGSNLDKIRLTAAAAFWASPITFASYPLQKAAMSRAVSRLISGQSAANTSVAWIVPIIWRQRAETPARNSKR
jgi:hypothetical protein